jgi:hypothetical protein
MADIRDKDLVEKEKTLVAEIETLLPDFARSCRGSEDVILIHQDSFAADYEDHETRNQAKIATRSLLEAKETAIKVRKAVAAK